MAKAFQYAQPSQRIDTREHNRPFPGGGGYSDLVPTGVCRWSQPLRKPVPIFKGHFGGKGYPLLRVFSPKNCVFTPYFSDEKGENI